MKQLFEIDLHDYDGCTKTFSRPSARGIIFCGDRLALVYSVRDRYFKFPGGGIHQGEDPENALVREVKEETGLDVTDIEYDRCQPWSFTSTLLFGFWCRTSGSDEIHMDKSELRLARWADREEELPTGSDASLTSYMINKFLKGLA